MPQTHKHPAALQRGRGAVVSGAAGKQNHRSRSNSKPFMEVMWDFNPPAQFHGRQAQTLGQLIDCGARGLTSGEASPLGWARRVAAYICELREVGLVIETVRETVADGVNVGRYFLQTSVRVLQREGC